MYTPRAVPTPLATEAGGGTSSGGQGLGPCLSKSLCVRPLHGPIGYSWPLGLTHTWRGAGHQERRVRLLKVS